MNTLFQKITLITFSVILILYYIPLVGEGPDSQLGAEYGHIAESLVKGKGYANVFAEDSGPTAWMLPLNTWLFTAVFYLFGIKTVAAKWAIIILNSLFWTLSGLVLMKLFSLTQYRRYNYFVLPLLFFIIFLNPNRSLGDMMDVSLVNFLSVYCVYVLYTFIYYNRNYHSLFLLAVVLPLSSPGLFLAYACVIGGYTIYKTYHYFKWNNLSRKLVVCLYVGGISLFTLSVWGVRNYVVMDAFILSKSNLWYEYYQANVADEDGILDKRTLQLYHPNNKGQFLDLYLQSGEVEFVSYFKRLSKESFDAADYMQRVLNRLKFSFFYNPNSSFYLKADINNFSMHDVDELEQQVLIMDDKWMVLPLEEDEFFTLINELHLDKQESVHQDWLVKKNKYEASKNRIISTTRAVLMPVLPILCILIGLVVPSIRQSGIFILSLFVYWALLLPYILISMSNRYLFFSQSLQVIFAFFVLAFIFHRLKKIVPTP